MRALVTGSNGFIGSFLVEKLLEHGYQVRCLIRKTSNIEWLKSLDVEFVYGELNDISSLQNAVRGADIIYHLGLIDSIDVEARGFAGVYNDGIVLKLDVNVEKEILRMLFIDAAGQLYLNTTPNEVEGIGGESFRLDLEGKVKILEVISFDSGFTIQVGGGSVELRDGTDLYLEAVDDVGYSLSYGLFLHREHLLCVLSLYYYRGAL